MHIAADIQKAPARPRGLAPLQSRNWRSPFSRGAIGRFDIPFAYRADSEGEIPRNAQPTGEDQTHDEQEVRSGYEE